MSLEILPAFMKPVMPSRLSYPGSTCGGVLEWEGPIDLLLN